MTPQPLELTGSIAVLAKIHGRMVKQGAWEARDGQAVFVFEDRPMTETDLAKVMRRLWRKTLGAPLFFQGYMQVFWPSTHGLFLAAVVFLESNHPPGLLGLPRGVGFSVYTYSQALSKIPPGTRQFSCPTTLVVPVPWPPISSIHLGAMVKVFEAPAYRIFTVINPDLADDQTTFLVPIGTDLRIPLRMHPFYRSVGCLDPHPLSMGDVLHWAIEHATVSAHQKMLWLQPAWLAAQTAQVLQALDQHWQALRHFHA